MSGTDGESDPKPLLEPRLVRFLKTRPRLVDRGFREEFFEQLEENITERRKPDTVAENAVREAFKSIEEAGGGVARNKVRDTLDKANQGPLERL